LFKLVQGRRAASELGRPSADWARPPEPRPSNLPKSPPDPELVKPAMLEEVIGKKTGRAAPADATPAPPPGSAARAEKASEPAGATAVKKAGPAKRAAKKKAAAAEPVKKAAAARKSPAKKAALPVPAPEKAPVAKKAAPVRKAPKKQA
jgi:hypothetical protein